MPPTHDFQCPQGHVTEKFVDHGVDEIPCPACDTAYTLNNKGDEVLHVWVAATKVFLKFPMAFVSQDIHYESPIDGRPITSMAARMDDLARSGCRPYDPEMKTDYLRRQKESDASLEKDMLETVDREIAIMPARKREKLEAEMHGGIDVETARMTAPAKPITTRINHGA